jgi:hypothetical protein
MTDTPSLTRRDFVAAALGLFGLTLAAFAKPEQRPSAGTSDNKVIAVQPPAPPKK